VSSVSGSAANCFNSRIDELYWATLLTPRVTAIDSNRAARLKNMDCWNDGAIDPFTHARWAALNSCCAEGVVIKTVVVVDGGVDEPEVVHPAIPSEQSVKLPIANDICERPNTVVNVLITALTLRQCQPDFAEPVVDEHVPGAR
jgi:hypothetical protein